MMKPKEETEKVLAGSLEINTSKSLMKHNSILGNRWEE